MEIAACKPEWHSDVDIGKRCWKEGKRFGKGIGTGVVNGENVSGIGIGGIVFNFG